MSTESYQIEVNGLPVDVVRKDIKNMHLGVYPPQGRVRVAAPLAMDDEAVRLAVIGKLGWIKRQQGRFEAQPRQTQRQMISGECHYFLGRPYRLKVIEGRGAARVVPRNRSFLDLYVRPGLSAEKREEVLLKWYRAQLKDLIPPLLAQWQPILGVEVADWRIKKMKTKWGTCNVDARRIWLNLELAKKPVSCLEYIVVHELIHLLERQHNDRFIDLMETHLPQWRLLRDELNRAPLAHDRWEY